MIIIYTLLSAINLFHHKHQVLTVSWSADAVACNTTTTNFACPTTVTENNQDGSSSTVKIKPGQIGDVRVDNKMHTCQSTNNDNNSLHIHIQCGPKN